MVKKTVGGAAWFAGPVWPENCAGDSSAPLMCVTYKHSMEHPIKSLSKDI